jgi:hypothetical protein
VNHSLRANVVDIIGAPARSPHAEFGFVQLRQRARHFF